MPDTPSLRAALEKIAGELEADDKATVCNKPVPCNQEQPAVTVADVRAWEACGDCVGCFVANAAAKMRAALAAPQVDPTDLETGKAIALTDAFLRHSTRDGEKRLNPAGELMAERVAAALSAARAQGERDERGKYERLDFAVQEFVERSLTASGGQPCVHPNDFDALKAEFEALRQPSTERSEDRE